MAIQKLDKANWGPYFDRLSKKLTKTASEERAEVKVASLRLGNQVSAEWLLLLGVTYDHQDDILEISLNGLEHIIHRPKTIFVDEESGALVSFEVIDAEDVQHIVQLRQPVGLSAPADNEVDRAVDEAGDESFPASDPPSWTGS
ncbi:MAG TPA: DUF5335 family protein [Acidocella sp.]|nr:DUF5335 family protein [Acidocella sp.]